jgi:hypothetical protein
MNGDTPAKGAKQQQPSPAALAARIRTLEARLDVREDPTLILPQSRLQGLLIGVGTVCAVIGAWGALFLVQREGVE